MAPSRNGRHRFARSPTQDPKHDQATKPNRSYCAIASAHNGTEPNPTSSPISSTSRNRYKPIGRRHNRAANND